MAKFNLRDDYSDGGHPDLWAALATKTTEPQQPYGEDEYTEAARKLIQTKVKNDKAAVYFLASGTLLNITAIGSCLRPHEAVIAASSGHIVVRETGAIEATGHKIITVPPVEGKLTPSGIEKALDKNSHYPHMAKPRLVYISNATEVGTLYTKSELSEISRLCHAKSLLLFLDGARLGVALAAERNDLTLEDIGNLTDMFWIGGTKAGALLGEALVINTPALQEDFKFHIKQRGGLLSKGRVLGLQFEALFKDDLFCRLASHANKTANSLSNGIVEAGYDLADMTETNQIFPILPNSLVERLQSQFDFYVWEKQEGDKSVLRLVTSWATDLEQVKAFVDMVRAEK